MCAIRGLAIGFVGGGERGTERHKVRFDQGWGHLGEGDPNEGECIPARALIVIDQGVFFRVAFVDALASVLVRTMCAIRGLAIGFVGVSERNTVRHRVRFDQGWGYLGEGDPSEGECIPARALIVIDQGVFFRVAFVDALASALVSTMCATRG